jgi:hypothetical protein
MATIEARLARAAGAVATVPPTPRLRRIAWADLTRAERAWVFRRLGAEVVEVADDETDEDLRNLSDEELDRRLEEARREAGMGP